MTKTEPSALVAQISAKLRELAAPWAAGDPGFADPQALVLAERADPYTGLASQVGAWPRDNLGRQGAVTINDDGSFFAEYDVLAWQGDRFVEAVTAWGRSGKLRGEARLLDATGEQVPV